tara:strand:+ start:4188 stop:4853 length:666 start_codon:yes stop_codon:yes gene_type:complete
MSLTVCVSATSTGGKLALTCQLRDYRGSASTERDSVESGSISAGSQWLERHYGQPLLAQVYSETVAGFGGRNLVLSRYPIIKVFRVFDSTSTDSATEILSSEYRVDAEQGMINRNAGFGWDAAISQGLTQSVIPTEERKPWLVEYSAGYFFPGTSSTEYGATSTGQDTLPPNIHQAVLMKASRLLERSGNVKSEAVGDFKVTYGESNDDTDILDLFSQRVL